MIDNSYTFSNFEQFSGFLEKAQKLEKSDDIGHDETGRPIVIHGRSIPAGDLIRISRYLVALFELNLATYPSLASDCKNALSHFKRLYFSAVDGKHLASEELKEGKKRIKEIYLSSPLFQNRSDWVKEERSGEITICCREGMIQMESSIFETFLSKLKEIRKGEENEEWDFSFYPKNSIVFLLSYITSSDRSNQHLPKSLLSRDTLLWTYSLANELKLTKLKRYVHYQLRLSFTKEYIDVDDFLSFYHQLQAFQQDFPKADFPLQSAHDHILLSEPWTLTLLLLKGDQELFAIAEKFAGLGYPPAQFLLGSMLHNGVGVERDEEKAISLYELAANQGYPPAQYTLGGYYSMGKGVEQDDAKAFALNELSAKQGYAPAQYNLSRCFGLGIGVEKNEEMEVLNLKLAAKQFFIPAMTQLGEAYIFGNRVLVQENPRKAFTLFQKGSDLGCVNATSYLGLYYLIGKFVNRDYQKAIAMFQQGADLEDPMGQHNLGVAYLEGKGVEQSGIKAMEWFKRAADKGHKYSRLRVIKSYREGVILPADHAKAEEMRRRILKSSKSVNL